LTAVRLVDSACLYPRVRHSTPRPGPHSSQFDFHRLHHDVAGSTSGSFPSVPSRPCNVSERPCLAHRRLPLPAESPLDFKMLPEYLFENVAEYIEFLSRQVFSLTPPDRQIQCRCPRRRRQGYPHHVHYRFSFSGIRQQPFYEGQTGSCKLFDNGHAYFRDSPMESFPRVIGARVLFLSDSESTLCRRNI
jgi:hypothetical protein